MLVNKRNVVNSNRVQLQKGAVTMKVILTADHAGMTIRNEVKSLLEEKGITYVDTGCDCETSIDYTDYALPAAERVAQGEIERGIFICWTGNGMSNAANELNGGRCA